MTSEDFAQRIEFLAARAADRVRTVGQKSYEHSPNRQAIEDYSLFRLRNELLDELADGVAYLTEVSRRVDEVLATMTERVVSEARSEV